MTGVKLLAGAALLMSLGAWALQASAAQDLKVAEVVQKKDVPSGGVAPEPVSEYRAILVTLDESIEIRRRIDSILQRVERLALSLGSRQREALAITRSARNELHRIAGLLGGAVSAAETSTGRLGVLDRRLVRSSELAALIAEELEELDRSLGP